MYCSCIRMEALHIRTMAGSLKVAGVLLSVGGTMIISLYKGGILHLWNPFLEHAGTLSFTIAMKSMWMPQVIGCVERSCWQAAASCLLAGISFR